MIDTHTNVVYTVHIIGRNLTALPYGSGDDGKSGFVRGWWNNGEPFVIPSNPSMYSLTVLWDGVEPPVCVGELASDSNGDCRVDLLDLSVLAAEWMLCDRIYDVMCP